MIPNWMVFAGSMMGVGTVVAGVSQLPPLTEGRLPPSVAPYGVESAPTDTRLYCRDTLTGVDCACFAQKADEILESPYQPVQGLTYADRWELARDQAESGC